MWIRKDEVTALSAKLRQAIDGETVEFRDNQEGPLSLLKNDLRTLVAQLGAERDAANTAQADLAKYMEDISHQLKTPVTSMMLMADLLEGAPPERQAEFLANIRESLARMDWLLDTLLKLARLDAGAVTFEPQPVQTQVLLEAALRPLAIMLDVQDQQVVLRNDHILFCDRRWTVEALTNLIKTGCEASPGCDRPLRDHEARPGLYLSALRAVPNLHRCGARLSCAHTYFYPHHQLVRTPSADG